MACHHERVFYNPYNNNEIWVSSFGNGMKLGNVVNIGTGDNPLHNSGISVSPNPCKAYLTIRISAENKNEAIEIFNMQGQLVFRSCFPGNANTISIADWEDGMYFIKCGFEIKKFVKIQQ